jgi:hypothetical protein
MYLASFLSPQNEASIFKGIPIECRNDEAIRNLMMTKCFTIKYRGPSNENYKRSPYNCIKEHAKTFSIYNA